MKKLLFVLFILNIVGYDALSQVTYWAKYISIRDTTKIENPTNKKDSFLLNTYGDVDSLFPTYFKDHVANLIISLKLMNDKTFELKIEQPEVPHIVLPHFILNGYFLTSGKTILLNVENIFYYKKGDYFRDLKPLSSNALNKKMQIVGLYKRNRIRLNFDTTILSDFIEDKFRIGKLTFYRMTSN